MFSAKNYGLPKDLIEAAKKVHEKQLMEYDEDGYINNPPEGMNKGTKKDREKAAKLGLKGPHLEGEGKLPKKQKLPPLPVRKPKNEEVQFTEEELAEAFAIFLEENFHVEMLTEEDLDYVFENEFPQWLEEGGLSQAFGRPERTGRSAQQAAIEVNRPIISQSSRDAHVGLTNAARQDRSGNSSREKILKDNPPTTKTNQTTREGRPVTSGGTLPSSGDGNRASSAGSLFPGEDALIKREKTYAMTGGLGDGNQTAKAPPVPTQKSAARKQVGANPTPTARKQVRRPAPKIDYKTPVTRRGSDGTYQLTSKGRNYVARKEEQERKKPFSPSNLFSQMQRDGN